MGDFERRVLQLVSEGKLTAEEAEELLQAHDRGPLRDIRQLIEDGLSDVRTRVRDVTEDREEEIGAGGLEGEGEVALDFQGDMALHVRPGEDGRYRVVWRTGRTFFGDGPERPQVFVEGRRIRIEAPVRGSGPMAFPFTGASLDLYLPADSVLSGQVSEHNGKIETEGLAIGKLSLETQNARIRVDAPRVGELTVVSRNGSIDVAAGEGEVVRVDAWNGRVAVRGALRDVEAMTRNGRIEAEMGAVHGGRCQLRTLNGAVELRLPAGVSAELRAQTVHGAIMADVHGLRIAEDIRDLTRRRLHGFVDGPLGDIKADLETTNGAVRIAQALR
ncbi:MAG: DUF4097 family beta strand repeat-containing protein [Thermaerobacter sp.]|nr:DUF4097 family beta strand repeat-containing protein [Thermaerobacter sp.]